MTASRVTAPDPPSGARGPASVISSVHISSARTPVTSPWCNNACARSPTSAGATGGSSPRSGTSGASSPAGRSARCLADRPAPSASTRRPVRSRSPKRGLTRWKPVTPKASEPSSSGSTITTRRSTSAMSSRRRRQSVIGSRSRSTPTRDGESRSSATRRCGIWNEQKGSQTPAPTPASPGSRNHWRWTATTNSAP